MAAPNIVNVTNIVGVTTIVSLGSSTSTTFLSNASSSNKVYRVNNITAVNIAGTVAADVTLRYHNAAAGAGTSIPIAFTLPVPNDTNLVVFGKDNSFYLEENRSLTAQASSANAISILCSYEDVS